MANDKYLEAQRKSMSDNDVTETHVSIGPLPNPDTLERIEKIAPGSAEKIVDDALQESKHRRELESTEQKNYWHGKNKGQLLAILIALVMISATVSLILLGHPIAGGIFGSATFISVIGMFMDNDSDGK